MSPGQFAFRLIVTGAMWDFTHNLGGVIGHTPGYRSDSIGKTTETDKRNHLSTINTVIGYRSDSIGKTTEIDKRNHLSTILYTLVT